MDPGSYTESIGDLIEAALARIPEVEAEILDLYFGIHGEPSDLDGVAQRLHLTVKEASELKEQALISLRQYCREFLPEPHFEPPSIDPSLPPLPDELTRLIDSGHWPASEAEAGRVDFWPHREHLMRRMRVFAPEESALYLFPPPFLTLAHMNAENWLYPEGAVAELDLSLAVRIADFGLGSDSLILLDYRESPDPPVIRMDWSRKEGQPFWVPMFPSFAAMAKSLGLATLAWR